MPEENTPEAFRRKLLLTLGMTVLVGLLVVLVWRSSNVLLLIFLGMLFGIALHALAKPVARLARIPRGLALIIVVLFLAGFFTLAGMLLIPTLSAQLDQLFTTLPAAAQRVERALRQSSWIQNLLERAPNPQAAIPNLPGDVLTQIGSVFSVTLGAVANLLFILVIGLFIAIAPEKYLDGLIRLVPLQGRPRAREVASAMGVTLRAWLLGQLVAMLSAAILTTVGLWILGVPLFLSLGFLAGLFEFIPTLGAVVAAVPAVLLAFTESPALGAYVIVLFVAIQQFQGNVIMPLVYQKAVSMPPALTLSAILLMSVLFGFLGVLVATPFVAVLVVLVRMLYVEDALGDKG